ncbi:MAG: M13 family peptidase [Novosphingobium sp.]|nr:M13 family peptidase [Novosphingobium sp.]
MTATFPRRFAVTTAVSALALLAAPVRAEQPAPPASASPAAAIPASESGDWGQFGIQMQYIDPAVKPGNDFATYVSGKWTAVTEIPADKTRIGAFDMLDDLSKDRLHAILDELTAAKPAPGTDEARIADAYRAYMNEAGIEAAGLAPARPFLQRIAAAKTLDDVAALFATPGFASPLGLFVAADARNSDIYAPYLLNTGLGLPDRSYYLDDSAKFRGIRAKYIDYLAFMLGQADIANPRTEALKILALETAMARAGWDRTVLRNVDLTYNKLTRAELGAIDRKGVLQGFFARQGIAPEYAIVYHMPPTDAELAAAKLTRDPAQIGGGMPVLLQLIADTPVSTWRSWLAAHFLSDHAQFLPRALDDAHFAFFGTLLSGQQEQKARWRRGIGVVEGQVGELLGSIYADRYFPAANKAAMAELVGNLRKAMAENLKDLSWMGADTRKQAEAKLASFTPKIGAPETFKTYDGLVPHADTPLANQLAARKWQSEDQLRRIGKPVDRAEWFMLPQTVNAYYNSTFNEVVFPAAILQPPFFNLAADPAVNYGAIGAVIGHEMGHGFDDQGAKSDGTGNLRDWWTAQDKANFEALQDRLAAQYDTFCPFDEGKTCVNGRLTMGENIGDLGGLSLAYKAYRLSLNGKPAPVIGGTTGDQRFFLAWAQVWRSMIREPLARQHLVVDPHSPPQYRVNGVVRNFDEWYEAFGVKSGDTLYLPPEERVRIW